MQADIASPSGTRWSNTSAARLTLCWRQRQAGQKVLHSRDAQSLDGEGYDSQALLFVGELNASTACSLSRFHRSSHSRPHSLLSCSCMACVQPAPLLMRSKELLQKHQRLLRENTSQPHPTAARDNQKSNSLLSSHRRA